MLSHKANLYVLLLIAFTACTKQNGSPVSSVSATNIVANASQPLQLPKQTIFGLIEEDASDSQAKADMSEADVNLLRLTIFLSETTANRAIDNYLSEGYNVQISISWYDSVNGSRAFPTDTNAVKAQADAFFKHYTTYKNQVPFVSIENEWDYQVQFGANLQDYLNELSVITAIGHTYGFKIADGGITSGALQRWTYSQLSGTAQQQWKDRYYVGLNNGYDALMNIINTYTAAATNINFDYSNVHWYNSIRCGNGFSTATQAFMKACNKKILVCNEFGIRTSSLNLFTQTDDEIKGNTVYAIAYSGSGTKGKAIQLTDAMLLVLN